MGYDVQHLGLCLSYANTGFLTAAGLAAAGSDWMVLKVHHPVQVKRLSCFISTAITAGTTAPQVTLYSRPTSGSTAGQVSLGVLTIPTGTAVGSVVYKELESVRVAAGYDLAFVVSRTAGDAGTPGGAGYMGAVILPDPDAPANQSKMIASA